MEYHEAADYLESLQRHRPKLGLDTTREMLAHLGNPDESFDCVQIAGSNGKGSTARMLDSVLQAAGLRVGLFTSPKLHDVREQIRVDGRRVPCQQLVEYVERIQPCVEELAADDDPTHFEVLTALALAHFEAEDVEVAVLEVGIGGRYDATSAVEPVASAVTTVSLEHTDLLGETVEEIARDKAQVAPEGRPLVTGATGDALVAIREVNDVVTVGETEADVLAVERGMASRLTGDVAITGPDWALETGLPLLGQHQAENAGVAATLARQVADVDTETIAAGLRGVSWPGRFEVIDEDPLVVLDGSHNPGATATLSGLLERFDHDSLSLVFGAMSEKDHEGMVAALPPVDTVYVTRPDVDRAAPVADLAVLFEGHADRIERVPSVPEATELALEDAGASDLVLVTGSLYAVAEARDRWTRMVVPKDRGRRPAGEALLGGAAFTDTSPETVDSRTLSVYLRPDQAVRTVECFDAVGGESARSGEGSLGEFVATVLTGTTRQFRLLADRLREEGLGLAHLAGQLEAALADGRAAREPTRSGTADGAAAVGTSDPGAGTGAPDSTIDRGVASLDTGGNTAVMGILNVTPDSFYDGGEYEAVDGAVERARELVAAGADVVDIGGESTRPGADPVGVEAEIDRVVPVIERLSDLEVPISVDTRKAAVADAALSAGADIVNDVSGLGDPRMRFVVADHDARLVLMHSVSAPVDPGRTTTYDDVVWDVVSELRESILLAERAGIDREQLIVDPGCGFGKRPAESFELVDRLPEFRALGCPVMVGHSRKSMFGAVGYGDEDQRLPPTLAVTALAAERGADLVRVHDVPENVAVVRTVAATNR